MFPKDGQPLFNLRAVHFFWWIRIYLQSGDQVFACPKDCVRIIGQPWWYFYCTTTERSICMGLFGNLFDFDGDGSTDALETALGLSIVFSIGEDEKENTTAEDDDFNELGEDLFESGVEKLESSREELSELEEQLMDMECREPDDILSTRYERWESRKEQLEEQISDLNDEISDLELEYEV